jgi:hypothetical protein
MSKNLPSGLTVFLPHPAAMNSDAQRIQRELEAALIHLGRAQAIAAPHSGRWPVMLGELREAQLLLAVNCGTARTAAEIDHEALTTSTR